MIMGTHLLSRKNNFTSIRRDLRSIQCKVDVERVLYPEFSHIYDIIEWRVNELLTISDI